MKTGLRWALLEQVQNFKKMESLMKHSLFQSPVIANRAETGHDDQKIGAAMLLHESDTGHDAALGIDTTMCSTSIGLAKGIAAGGYKPSAKR